MNSGVEGIFVLDSAGVRDEAWNTSDQIQLESKSRVFALHTKYISSPQSLTFNDISTYIPEYWISIDGNETLISSGTELHIPDYDNLEPMYDEIAEDISVDHYWIMSLEFYDLDENGYADHLNVLVLDYFDFDLFWILAWDNDGDQYIDTLAIDLDFDGVAD